MNEPMIEVKDLGKRYYLGADRRYKRFTENFTNALLNPVKTIKNARAPKEEFWALKDVSFTVDEGEVVGIIGRNGAGKSTLLKILSQITYPTKGEVRLRGRVGSLLEVGTGFHPELTGRENIYMNGAILGMRKREIDAKFDEIVKFAEVEKFLDTPVKRYSSGMYVRLAFAVAAHLEPEILVVDEVLAVGDAQFQKKCLGKMKDVSKGGRTVLFVSHNMGAIKTLCAKAFLLEAGKMVFNGEVISAISKYYNHERGYAKMKWVPALAPKIKSARMLEVGILNDGRQVGTELSSELPIQIYIIFKVEDKAKVGTSILLNNSEGQLVFVSMSNHEPNWHMKERPVGTYKSVCEIPANLLAEGDYSISIPFWEGFYESGIVEKEVLKFSVHEKGFVRGDYPHIQKGHLIQPLLKWQSERIENYTDEIKVL